MRLTKESFRAALIAPVLATVLVNVLGLAAGPAFANPQPEATIDAAAFDVVHQAKRAVARQVSDLLADPSFRILVEERVTHSGDRVALNDILGAYRAAGGKSLTAVESILAEDLAVRTWKGTADYTPGLMELRLVGPAVDGRIDLRDVLVAFEPAGDDSRWTVIEAFDRAGRIHQLDAHMAPEVPVLVADLDAREDLRAGLELINETLRAAGLQASEAETVERALAGRTADKAISCSGIETAKISNIRLDDDQEPWIKGAAEIYAFVSGIDPTLADPEIRLVDMPYLDHDGTTYYPNQILIFWYNYRFNAANVTFYEHDDGTNYQDLLSAVLTGVRTILGAFAPEYAIIAEVANAIIQAMPGSWFTDDDDYVDTVYTIDTDDLTSSAGRTYNGAGANVTMKLVPYCLN